MSDRIEELKKDVKELSYMKQQLESFLAPYKHKASLDSSESDIYDKAKQLLEDVEKLYNERYKQLKKLVLDMMIEDKTRLILEG